MLFLNVVSFWELLAGDFKSLAFAAGSKLAEFAAMHQSTAIVASLKTACICSGSKLAEFVTTG